MGFLTSAAIDVAALADGVRSDRRGALVTFVGPVRDHHGGRQVERLVYSAYVPMAEGAEYVVSVSASGLVVRPANDAARKALGGWK